MRVTVRDAKTKAFVPKVQVKVIGSDNPHFLSGETDLRGVFVADGIRGHVTAVARNNSNQYAFHRGTTYLGHPPSATPPQAPAKPGESNGLNLEQNLRMQNSANQMRQLQRLEDRYNAAPSQGVKVEQAK